jgi:nucleotide-binding universal stress UspA family protein
MTTTDSPRYVLVGLGEAQDGIPALEWAAREAKVRNLDLHIVRSYHWANGLVPWETSTEREISSDLRQDAEARLERAIAYVEKRWPEINATRTAVDGVAWDVLVELGAHAPVTVLGSRHLGLVGGAVLGSVSTVVAARANGPVVVVEGLAGDPAENPAVVVGIDGSPNSNEVLAFAFDHASRHGRPLLTVFCWRPDLIASMQWRPEQPPPARADRWLAEATAGWQEKFPDVDVHRAVVRDHPVAGLVAESTAQDLLVVGSHGRHPRVGGLLGSVSQGVLHHATCPVAVIHPRSDE